MVRHLDYPSVQFVFFFLHSLFAKSNGEVSLFRFKWRASHVTSCDTQVTSCEKFCVACVILCRRK
jgi:hypothetical protein